MITNNIKQLKTNSFILESFKRFYIFLLFQKPISWKDNHTNSDITLNKSVGDLATLY